MTIISALPGGSGDAFAQLVEGLRLEFRCVDVAALAARILESERAEFHWSARVAQHYLGQHFELECNNHGEGSELARMAILSFVAGRWHAGVCLVDGDAQAVDLLWLRSFDRREDAADMFANAR